MAGIYLHIPFCKQRCCYCDFFSSTGNEKKSLYVEVLCHEIEERKNYLEEKRLNTIYFGGGTPSLLSAEEFMQIFSTINDCFEIADDAEITLEANPDDLTETYLSQLRPLPFNRVSIGIQSFKDDDLKRLNRRHSSEQAITAVKRCRENGFENISIDLMYGLPGQTEADWRYNIDTAVALNPEHISAYSLTYEEGTKLFKQLKSGSIKATDDETGLLFYQTLIDKLEEAGYIHYEISNFAKQGFISRHNSSYWKNIPYIGVGAAAHSYNGTSRQWNIASIEGYFSGNRLDEVEQLDTDTRYNDYIITRLRTIWGADMEEIEKTFGLSYRDYFRKKTATYIANNLLAQDGTTFRLTRKGLFVSDSIVVEFLKV